MISIRSIGNYISYQSDFFTFFVTRSISLMASYVGIWARSAISSLNQSCLRALSAVILFFGQGVNIFFNKSTPELLSLSFGMISRSLFSGYLFPTTYIPFFVSLNPGQLASVGEPTILKIESRSSIYFFYWKIGVDITNSAKMHPIDHISTSVEQIVGPSRSSGARYQRLITSWVIIPSSSALLASPKSQIFKTPPFEYKRLEGLRSLCTMFLECKNYIPNSKSFISRRI